MIQTDITSAALSYTGGTFSPTVTYPDTTYGGVTAPSCPNWITFEYIGGAQEGSDYVESYRFIVSENDGAVRNGTITLQCTDTHGDTWYNYISVTQGSGVLVVAPIWKDTYYFAEREDTFVYSIRTGGVAVYYGKAYCAPGAGGPYVQVNQICRNYLKNVLPDFRGTNDQVYQNEGAVMDFSLCGEGGYEVCNYRFLLDWYGDWAGESGYVMTEPINGHLDPRMMLMHTEYNDAQTSVTYEIEDGQ